jgi:elongation factor G
VAVACDEAAPVAALVIKTRIDQFTGRLNTVRVLSGVIKSDLNLFNSTTGKKERIGMMILLKGKEQEQVKELRAGQIGTLVKLDSTRTGDTLCEESRKLAFPPIPWPQPIYSLAVKPRSRQDETRMSSAMQRMMDEDPAFRYEQNGETKELLINGMGQVHLNVALDKLKRKFGVEVDTSIPKVPYKETIKGEAKVEGKHKKQTGGAGQFGVAWIHFQPRDPNESDPLEFVDNIVGGSIPKQFIPAVEKGLRQYMVAGAIAGYPICGLRAILYDGKYHPVDSKEIAFVQAARKALKLGMQQAKPILVEPIYNLTVYAPEENLGDIMGDLSSKRGRIYGTDKVGNLSVIKAKIPLAEIQEYVAGLNSLTQGRGTFEMVYDHYEEVPHEIANKIIAARAKLVVEEEED